MEEKQKNEAYKIIIAVIISVTITFSATLFGYYYYLEKSGALVKTYQESQDVATSLDVIQTYIEKYYKGEIDSEDLKNAALKGFVNGLGDEYTVYMTKEELEALQTSLSDYTGIGCYVSTLKDNGGTIVVSIVKEECPASRAGIEPGDIFLEVDGEDVSQKDSQYLSSVLKGEDGSKVHVKVKRDEEELEFDLIREKIKVYEIESKMLEDNIGYIQFQSFTETSSEEFENAFRKLKSEGAKKIIIDLRSNTGGYVSSALKVADMIIPKGETLLITEDKDGNKSETKAENDPIIDEDIKLVVLVNQYTASASEILTGILKDYDRATIIGQKTYGKGVIQSIVPNVVGGALKITSSEYYTPDENKINKIGITPDIEVEESTDENDLCLEKAKEILK